MGMKPFCHCTIKKQRYITLRKYSNSGSEQWHQDDGIRPLVMCVTPDGKYVFTGCNRSVQGQGQVRKYDGATGSYLPLPNGGFLNQQVSAIHTDGTLLVVGVSTNGGNAGIVYAFDLNLNLQWQASTTAFIQSVRVANSAVYVVLAVASPKPANPVSLQKYDGINGNLKWSAAPPVMPGDTVDPQNYAVYSYPNLVGDTVFTGGGGSIPNPGNLFLLSNRDDGLNKTNDADGSYLGAITARGVVVLANLQMPGGYTSFNSSGGALIANRAGLYLEDSAGVIQWLWNSLARVACTDNSMNVCGGFLSGTHGATASQQCGIGWMNPTSFTLSFGGASANVPWPVTFSQFFSILQGICGAGNVRFTNSNLNTNIPLGSGGTITFTGALENSIQPAFLSSDNSSAGAVVIFNGGIGGPGFTTASFDANGNPLWTADHSTNQDIGYVSGIATDSSQNTYTIGNRVRL
jgi:hypothetical protein